MIILVWLGIHSCTVVRAGRQAKGMGIGIWSLPCPVKSYYELHLILVPYPAAMPWCPPSVLVSLPSDISQGAVAVTAQCDQSLILFFKRATDSLHDVPVSKYDAAIILLGSHSAKVLLQIELCCAEMPQYSQHLWCWLVLSRWWLRVQWISIWLEGC